MNTAIHILYFALGGLATVFLILFAWSAWRESRPRALAISILSAVIWCLIWFGSYRLLGGGTFTAGLLIAAAMILVGLVLGPVGRVRRMDITSDDNLYDERDTVFAREEYLPGSDEHAVYYTSHPELLEVDDRIRSQPELLAPGGRYYDRIRSSAVSGVFREIEALTTAVDGPVGSKKAAVDPLVATQQIKKRVLDLGAGEVGVARLDPRWIYSHVGRGPEPWGQAIESTHRYAIVFALEMDYNRVEQAPNLAITEETADSYLQGAQISTTLATEIRADGFSARAHIAGSNYQVILPALAHDAGLGEVGRMGYLISRRLGGRIRLGAITTDLPLVPDKPIAFGVQDFCDRCGKCVDNCPSGAIPNSEPEYIRGVQKWQLNAERCLLYWRAIGTDCGLCMKVCPYSHPHTLVHRIIQGATSRSSFARTFAVWGDDLFYGRRAKYDRSVRLP